MRRKAWALVAPLARAVSFSSRRRHTSWPRDWSSDVCSSDLIEGLAGDLAKATEPMLEGYNMEVASPAKIRELIKASIEFLLDQKAELENAVQEDIDWSEGLLTNLKDVHDQLGEMESDMTDDIAASFRHIKNSVTQQLTSELPKLLQNCSEFIEEDSNFSTLHVDLNEEMNRRMAVYMKNFVNDNLKSTIQDWIGDCKREFDMSQRNFNELSKNLNQKFNEEKIVLQSEFKVLDDWRRDLERIARSLLRFGKGNLGLG